MTHSPQLRTISCIYETVLPASSGRPPTRTLKSLSPEMVGYQFGHMEIVSNETCKIGTSHHMRVRCRTCKIDKWISIEAVRRGLTNGCRKCSQGRQVPQWLEKRLSAAKQRCTNQNSPQYMSYGAKGVEFRFESVIAGALWVQENLGLHRNMELDRRENTGHYEPGNLRWLPKRANQANRAGQTYVKTHDFRKQHPEVRYADTTLKRLILSGLTPEEIVHRWRQPSCKPKGVYGTCSTPDPAIVSLLLAA